MFEKFLEFRQLKNENKQLKKTIKDIEETLDFVRKDKKAITNALVADLTRALDKMDKMAKEYNELTEEMYNIKVENEELRRGQEAIMVEQSKPTAKRGRKPKVAKEQ